MKAPLGDRFAFAEDRAKARLRGAMRERDALRGVPSPKGSRKLAAFVATKGTLDAKVERAYRGYHRILSLRERLRQEGAFDKA